MVQIFSFYLRLFHHAEMTLYYLLYIAHPFQGYILFRTNGFMSASDYTCVLICFLSAGIKELSGSTLDSRLLIVFAICQHEDHSYANKVKEAIMRLGNKQTIRDID